MTTDINCIQKTNFELELTILMPCLNEEKTVLNCIKQAKEFINRNNLKAEILIADNGSCDNSVKIAKEAGARVVNVPQKGYGCALRGGIKEAQGKYIIMGDCDESYDFLNLEEFLSHLRAGASLVMGDRFSGGFEDGAMPFSHRYIGVPFLSWLGRIAFKTNVRDFHSGLRAICRKDFENIEFTSTGMEFATEMVAKAATNNMKIAQVPICLKRDGRNGAKSHLRTVRDGFRHVMYILKNISKN